MVKTESMLAPVGLGDRDELKSNEPVRGKVVETAYHPAGSSGAGWC